MINVVPTSELVEWHERWVCSLYFVFEAGFKFGRRAFYMDLAVGSKTKDFMDTPMSEK